MPTAYEHFSEQFQTWEARGRGWKVFDGPVQLEPPFVPFEYRPMTDTPVEDDGQRHTVVSSLLRFVSRKLSTEPPPAPIEPEEEPKSEPLVREECVEFQISLPDKSDASVEAFGQFLNSLSKCREPIAFEILGIHKRVTVQFAVGASDAPLLRRQLSAYFPEVVLIPIEKSLETAWNASAGDEMLAVEFGLEKEFMLPLAGGKLDPFVGIVGALSELRPGELGLFQVLWQPVGNPWAESMTDAVTHRDGKPLFVNATELAGAAEQKVAKPLYAVVVRIMLCTEASDRLLQLASDLTASFGAFENPHSNALIPLHNEDYPFEEHIMDVLRRQSRRVGMILSGDELTGFAHLPSTAVRSPAFQRQTGKTKAAPSVVSNNTGLLIGTNEHAGKTVEVRLSPDQRVRHTHVIGATGTGKSTLLFNLIRQSIENSEGIAVLDPHGDLIDRVLGVIPESRVGDVVLVDPSDAEYAVGFNILSAHSDLERSLLASDLVAVFQRLSTSWGDQMNSVLQNAILAFLESDRRGTIADLRRFLVEPAFRNEFLKSVRDSEVIYYWQKSFPLLTGNKSVGPILTRLDAFLAQKPIRHMVCQPENKLDFGHIMDSGKIFLVKLSEGTLGRENSHLLGTLLVAKFQQIAMSRQAQQMGSRRMFNIFIDEFANFITPSMAEILSKVRKYGMGLTLVHHELHQLQRSPEVASAVMTHPYTRAVFRVSDDDARKLAEGFSFFEAKDLKNLDTGQAICRVERGDFDFNLSVPMPESVDEDAATARRRAVVTVSREKYSTRRSDVEAMLVKSMAPAASSPPPKQTDPKSLALPAASGIPVSAPAREGAVKASLPSPPHLNPEPPGASPAAEIPQPAELPKASEVPKPVAPIAKVETNETPKEPRDLGRGGAQHQAIQKRIKEAAEKLGFHSVIEKPVLDRQGSVDLWLERNGQSIACEISITTTIDHEVGNVGKCLKAGVPKVAVICLDEDRLQRIKAAVAGSLGPELSARVDYYQPDAFIAHLKSLKPPEAQPSESQVGGYKVKRSFPKHSPQEQKQKEDIANQAMRDAMRKRKK